MGHTDIVDPLDPLEIGRYLCLVAALWKDVEVQKLLQVLSIGQGKIIQGQMG